MAARRLLRRLVLLPPLLVGALLRAHDLAGQSLWSDEDITLDRARLPLAEMLAQLPVEHGPLYFALQRGWTRLAGESDLALRWPSLLAGVVAIPLAHALGRRLGGRGTASILAWLTAISPFLISYGQEARMYALVHALALAALVAALTGGERARRQELLALDPWIVTGVAAALAVLAHLYGALVVVALGGWALLDVAGARGAARRRLTRGWIAAAVAAALLLLPWLPRAMGVLAHPGWREPLPLASLPWRLLVATSAQTSVTALRPPEPTAVATAVLYGALAAVGLLVLGRAARSTRGARRALVYIALPTALAAVLAWRNPDVHPRYYVALLPALQLAMAAGAAALPRPGPTVALAALALAAAPPLATHYGDPAARKQDYRALVDTVLAAAPAEETVLLLDGPSFGLAKRYTPPGADLKIENLTSSTNRERLADDPRALERRLLDLSERRPHVWLATDGGAELVAERTLGAALYPVRTLALQNVTLRRYLAPSASDDPLLHALPRQAVDATDPSIASLVLRPALAVEPPAPPVELSAHHPRSIPAGGILPIVLRWRPGDAWPASAPAGAPHRLSLRLLGPAGEVRASVDRPPLEGLGLPTTRWSTIEGEGPSSDAPPRGAPARGPLPLDPHGLSIPADTPLGAHELVVLLYDAGTLAPFASWSLGTVRVAPAR